MSKRLHTRGFRVALAIPALLAIGTLAAGGAPCDLQPELDAVLTRDLHFSPADVTDLERGKLVKHTLPATAPEGSRERLLAAYRDIVSFKRSEAVPEVGVFSDPPSGSDLDALTIGRDDFDL